MSRRGAAEVIQEGFASLGISQKEFAAQLGVDPATVNRWLKGTQLPRGNVVPLLARTVGVDEVELWKAIGTVQIEEIKELRQDLSQTRRDNEQLQQTVRDLITELRLITVELRDALQQGRGDVPPGPTVKPALR